MQENLLTDHTDTYDTYLYQAGHGITFVITHMNISYTHVYHAIYVIYMCKYDNMTHTHIHI